MEQAEHEGGEKGEEGEMKRHPVPGRKGTGSPQASAQQGQERKGVKQENQQDGIHAVWRGEQGLEFLDVLVDSLEEGGGDQKAPVGFPPHQEKGGHGGKDPEGDDGQAGGRPPLLPPGEGDGEDAFRPPPPNEGIEGMIDFEVEAQVGGSVFHGVGHERGHCAGDRPGAP